MICLIVFFGSGYYVAKYVLENLHAEKTVQQVADTRARGLAEVYAQNNDLVGWIEIEGTKINYPVMQTGGGSSEPDPEFYLHRDFNKEYSESGTPFVDSYSRIAGATKLREGADEDSGGDSSDSADWDSSESSGSDASSNSGSDSSGDTGSDSSGDTGPVYIATDSTWNWLIYGHHMKFGTMFHDLMEFEDKAFWEDHKTFHFDRIMIDSDGSIEEIDEDYEIIAAAYSQIYPDESNAFKYYAYAGFYDEQKFNEFLDGVKAESCYDTGIGAEYGDQLVTLSTCAYHTEDGRFYIVGKRIE